MESTLRVARLSLAAVTLAAIATTTANAQQQVTYEVVASFDGVFVDGQIPSGLIQASDGNFYGTTFTGGLLGGGTVFRIDAAGVLTTVHHFPEREGNYFRSDGAGPIAGVIQASDGNFYGTTEFGGFRNAGTVFRLDSAGRVTNLHEFSLDDGSQPSLLVEGSEGELFGVTIGPVYSVFRIDREGTFTTLHRFEDFSVGALIRATDGSLYGTSGSGGAFNQGTVFKLDASGTFTTLHDFSGPDGRAPIDLIQGSDGDFYGVTAESQDPYQEGTIFKIDATGTFTTLYRFLRGTNHATALIQGIDGSFYGIAGSEIFRFQPGGTPTTIRTVPGVLAHVLQARDGSLYGTGGGTTTPGGGGMIVKLDLTGTLAVVHTFVGNSGPAHPFAHVTEASNGRFYGTTSRGGLSDGGTVFTIESSGDVRILRNFFPGARLSSGLVQATDGLFYGTGGGGSADAGGVPIPGTGVVFSIDSNGIFTTRFTFSAIPPGGSTSSPNGLIQATDGFLYGTTNSRVFRLPLSGPLGFLTSISGDSDAALVEATDGSFYGTTRTGGASDLGTIFSVSGGTLHSFSGADGSSPIAPVIEGLDGNLYGTTPEGGVFGYGTVFRFDPAGTVTTLHHFSHVDGANPYAGLLLASDGRLYGTTRNGGAFDFGTIFRIDATGTLTILHNFAPDSGAYPEAALIQATDGHLYGTTTIGGPDGGGVVFRVRLDTSPADTYYELVSRNSGKCLDVYGASMDAVASVIQWVCHGGENQHWRLDPAGGGAFRITARHSGQALDVFGALLDDVTPIIQYPAHGGDNQAWTLEPASDGYVSIVARHSGKALDVEGASVDDGARVIQYSPHAGANQQWLLRRLESAASPVVP